MPLGRDEPILGQMAAQRVDRLRPLPHQQVAGPEHHAPRLLLLASSGATKRMVGRGAASAIASASAASFFCRLTNGFT